jgi:hypothetical protein
MDLSSVACVGQRRLFSFARRDNLIQGNVETTQAAGADAMMVGNRSRTGSKIARTRRGVGRQRAVAIPT